MRMCHSDVHALRNYSARTKAPDIKTTILVDQSYAQSFDVMIDFVASTG